MKEKIKRWLLQLIYTKKSLRRKVERLSLENRLKALYLKNLPCTLLNQKKDCHLMNGQEKY
jgi:hypothetical protein